MRLPAALLAALLVLPLAACTDDDATQGAPGPSASAAPTLHVVTTVAPITSIAAAVAGDRARIDGIVPEGTNSHTFEPPPSAAKVLSEADLVIINGLKLEDPTKELAEANMKDGAKLLEIGTEVLAEQDYIYDFSFPKDEGKPNPHLWTDPTYAIKYAEQIRGALTEIDSGGRDYYDANYQKFREQATALSDAIKADQESLDADDRELLTYHDAYAYFAKSYGWNVIGAIQPSDFSEPTPKEVAELIDQIKEQGVKAIFGSEVFPSKALAEIGKATGAVYEDTLRDDDLPGAPGEPEHSWLGLMRYDFRTIIARLGGTTKALDALDTTPAVPDTANYPQ
ncbi:metal ABC transporter substrate-binding protein [Sporichthya sp.]|uniref:metal ABC transporter substrate-binding protein n=1 Tax=Sporichthya sp. TaxID=65475 RepID=UPI0017F3ACCB|nr:metal ABC transporter substrate-binding protein [Sporichthya sp.]MBA3745366.1 zinc ABC transporter substrate-binding protein [Sporichthya sp.]